jgi:hypothetical protein
MEQVEPSYLARIPIGQSEPEKRPSRTCGDGGRGTPAPLPACPAGRGTRILDVAARGHVNRIQGTSTTTFLYSAGCCFELISTGSRCLDEKSHRQPAHGLWSSRHYCMKPLSQRKTR